MLKPNLSTPESREFWAQVKRIAAEVESWPAWKRLENFSNLECSEHPDAMTIRIADDDEDED